MNRALGACVASSDPSPGQERVPLQVIQGRTQPVQLEASPSSDAERWKGWVVVLLVVIFFLLTVHMDGPKFLGTPDLGTKAPLAGPK